MNQQYDKKSTNLFDSTECSDLLVRCRETWRLVSNVQPYQRICYTDSSTPGRPKPLSAIFSTITLANTAGQYTLVNMLTEYILCKLMYRYILVPLDRARAFFSHRPSLKTFGCPGNGWGKGVANIRFHTRHPTLYRRTVARGIISTFLQNGRPSSTWKIIPAPVFYNFHYLPHLNRNILFNSCLENTRTPFLYLFVYFLTSYIIRCFIAW